MNEPVLLDVGRGPLVESRHRGRLVVLAPDGSVTAALGPVEEPVYPRSSLKPLQAAAMVRCGLVAAPAALALASASHDGEGVHIAGVRESLAAAGLDDSALGCPPDLPMGREPMLAYVAGRGLPARVCHNCSGKHAAMVATCVACSWDVGSYLSPDHPLQVAIASSLEEACGAPIAATSVDGCGAPAHALPLVALARGFARLTTAAVGSAEGRIAAAMRAHPRLVGGQGRAVTELMTEVGGLVAKDGAEGVWAAALPDGRACAIKVADGAMRALPPLLAAVLRSWGFDGAAVRRWSTAPVLGGGAPVGDMHWAAPLRDALALP